jgi:hypothetical protein
MAGENERRILAHGSQPASGRADPVVLGRVLLFDPHWPLHAANALRAHNVT